MATLREQLDRIRENAKKRFPTDALRIVDGAREELQQSGITERTLKRGDSAPSFSLPDVDGTLVSSQELLKRGPLVISFYRGKW